MTFLPKSLLLQFARYANIYFLCIAIIQSIPVLSPLSPFSAIAPLVFVLGLSMGREGTLLFVIFSLYRLGRLWETYF